MKRMYGWVLPGVLGLGLLAGCEMDPQGMPILPGMPDEAINQQEQWRMNQPLPRATELPPGLAEDLPRAETGPATQPAIGRD